MSTDPLGAMARINALSLMLITPEFYRIRKLREAKAAKIDSTSRQFSMQPEHIEIDGLKIRLARSECNNAPTILFLSPLPQSILCYDAVWSQLIGKVNLVALDLPGFGGSQGSKDYMSFSAQSAFLEIFLGTMKLNDVHIVAPDIAMPVALHYAIHRKSRLKSLLVGDGPGILPSADGSLIKKIVGSGFWRTLVRLNGAKTFIAGAMQLGYLHYSPNHNEVEDYVASYSGRIGQVTEFFKQYPHGCKGLTDAIDNLNLPVQIFWGDEDAFLKVENAHILHGRLPNSSIHVFEECGHFCYQDQSSAFADLLCDWVLGERYASV